MTEYEVKVTRQAKEHLRGIRDYIATTLCEPGTAKKMLEVLRLKIQSLSSMPKRFRVIDEQPWGDYGIRKTRVKNFYVYFWVNEDRKQVQIIAVIYVRMDQIKQLESTELPE